MFDDFTSCAVCQRNTGEKCELFGRVIGMHGCSSGVERKPRNHFEAIKNMSAEELAKWFNQYLVCPPKIDCPKDEASCEKCWLEWLKGEAQP